MGTGMGTGTHGAAADALPVPSLLHCCSTQMALVLRNGVWCLAAPSPRAPPPAPAQPLSLPEP